MILGTNRAVPRQLLKYKDYDNVMASRPENSQTSGSAALQYQMLKLDDWLHDLRMTWEERQERELMGM